MCINGLVYLIEMLIFFSNQLLLHEKFSIFGVANNRKMAKSKPRVIKNFEKLDEELRNTIIAAFPNGFTNEIKTFDIGGGRFMSALPFETEEFSYLIKFPVKEDVDLETPEDGGDDEMHLEGADSSDDDDEDDDEIEQPMDNIEDLEVADEEE